MGPLKEGGGTNAQNDPRQVGWFNAAGRRRLALVGDRSLVSRLKYKDRSPVVLVAIILGVLLGLVLSLEFFPGG